MKQISLSTRNNKEAEVSINRKGQITIPVKMRNKLNIKTGDDLLVKMTENGELILSVKERPTLMSLKGVFALDEPHNKSWDQIMDETKEEIAEHARNEGRE